MKDAERELARFALALIQQARVPATEQDLRNVLTVRAWLTQIANGELIVTGRPEVAKD